MLGGGTRRRVPPGEMGLEGPPVPAPLVGTGVFPVSMELLGLYPSMPPASPVRALGLPLSNLAGVGAVCDGVEVAILPPGMDTVSLAGPRRGATRMGALCHWPPPRWR